MIHHSRRDPGRAPRHEDRYEALPDDEFMLDLLGGLEGDFSAPPEALSDRTIRKVHAEITSRDLIELTTFVFLMRFCAPMLDLFAGFLGQRPEPASLRPARSSREPQSRSQSETRHD